MKMVVIGGGSSYTPELIEGLIVHRASLPLSELILVDVAMGKEKVEIITGLVNRMFKEAHMTVKVSWTLDRQSALVNADFVLTQFRVGGLVARAYDERLPLKYGMVGQETTGAGGFAKGMRTIPEILSIAKDMESLCPESWLINFTNPSGMVTEAVLKHTSIKSIGLCNVPINLIYESAERLKVPVSAIDCHFIGLNHLSFIDHVWYEGQERIMDVLDTVVKDDLVSNISRIESADGLARALQLIPTPYMQYYFYEQAMLMEEKDKMDKGEGTRAEEVMKVEKALFEKYANQELSVKPKELEQRGGARYSEAAIALIDSLWNDRQDIQVVNVRNGDTFKELPHDAVVETNCRIGKNGAEPMPSEPLPLKIKGLIQYAKAYESLTIEAAVERDKTKALLALNANPLVHHADDAAKLLDELIDAHQPYLDYLKVGIDRCLW